MKRTLECDNYCMEHLTVLTPLGIMDREPTLPARYYNEEIKQYTVVCLEFRIERTEEDLGTLVKIHDLMNESDVRHPRTLEEARKDADIR